MDAQQCRLARLQRRAASRDADHALATLLIGLALAGWGVAVLGIGLCALLGGPPLWNLLCAPLLLLLSLGMGAVVVWDLRRERAYQRWLDRQG